MNECGVVSAVSTRGRSKFEYHRLRLTQAARARHDGDRIHRCAHGDRVASPRGSASRARPRARARRSSRRRRSRGARAVSWSRRAAPRPSRRRTAGCRRSGRRATRYSRPRPSRPRGPRRFYATVVALLSGVVEGGDPFATRADVAHAADGIATTLAGSDEDGGCGRDRGRPRSSACRPPSATCARSPRGSACPSATALYTFTPPAPLRERGKNGAR